MALLAMEDHTSIKLGPDLQPVVPDYYTDGNVTLDQQQGCQQIHHRPCFKLKDEDGKGYRARLLIQNVGMKNTIRRFLEAGLDGDVGGAYKYYDMARTTIMCFPEGMNHKVPTSWKNLLSAARTFLKLCINVSSKGNVEYEKWNCNVCNVSVQPQKKKHVVIWECPCCLGRPSLMHHMFIYTRGNSDMNKFYNYLLNTKLLEES